MQVMRKREKLLWATGLLTLIALFAVNVTANPTRHHLDSEFGSLRHAHGAVVRSSELEDSSH